VEKAHPRKRFRKKKKRRAMRAEGRSHNNRHFGGWRRGTKISKKHEFDQASSRAAEREKKEEKCATRGKGKTSSS